jgi:NADH:ubiquinone oxidoreductase subunit 3 (subunit A)
MGDITVPFMVINICLFCLIFWVLTILGEKYYKKKEHTSKKQFYECGFRSLSGNKIGINLNFTLLAIFLILYDVEFLVIYPVLFNFWSITFVQYVFFLIFISFIILSLYYDFQVNALSWQY